MPTDGAGREFIDYVAAGVVLMERRDKDTWALGDLAADFAITLGRPDDPDAPTLGDLASGWNVSTQRVSEWRSVSAFYPTDDRTFSLPWEMYNQARRACKDTPDPLDNACEMLDFAETRRMTVKDFRRYLTGVRWEGPLHKGVLPKFLQILLPDFESQFWVTIKRYKEGD